jgi:hypothetical protein
MDFYNYMVSNRKRLISNDVIKRKLFTKNRTQQNNYKFEIKDE